MGTRISIEHLDLPELQIYRETSENRLAHCLEPEPGLFIVESPRVILRALEAGYTPVSILCGNHMEDEDARRVLALCDVPVYVGESELLQSLTGFSLTRGMLCAMKRKPLKSMEEVCQDAKRIVILEDVVNPTNVGAIFRSAAALGVDAVLLTPNCADPLYRRAERVGMGTMFQVPWTYIGIREGDWKVDERKKAGVWPVAGMEELKALGFSFVAMALRKDTIDIRDERLAKVERLAILMGTEGEGLKEETMDACDYTVKIPMFHDVDSLNVAAASAVAFWELAGKLKG